MLGDIPIDKQMRKYPSHQRLVKSRLVKLGSRGSGFGRDLGLGMAGIRGWVGWDLELSLMGIWDWVGRGSGTELGRDLGLGWEGIWDWVWQVSGTELGGDLGLGMAVIWD